MSVEFLCPVFTFERDVLFGRTLVEYSCGQVHSRTHEFTNSLSSFLLRNFRLLLCGSDVRPWLGLKVKKLRPWPWP